jgi:hypothetical protein
MTTTIAHVRRFAAECLNCAQVLLGAATIVALFWIVCMWTFAGVARVDVGRGGDLVTVVGSVLGAQPGEALRMRGRWGSHPQFGRQFHVENYTTVLPATVQGIRNGINLAWGGEEP